MLQRVDIEMEIQLHIHKIIALEIKIVPLFFAADRNPIIPPIIDAPINIAMKEQIEMTNRFLRYQGRLVKMVRKISQNI